MSHIAAIGETSLLKRRRFAVLALGHIENDRMSMKLRRSVAIHRTGSVMLKGGGNESARRLGRVDIADVRLRKPLEFAKCYAHTFTVRLADTLIAAH